MLLRETGSDEECGGDTSKTRALVVRHSDLKQPMIEVFRVSHLQFGAPPSALVRTSNLKAVRRWMGKTFAMKMPSEVE